MFFKFRTSHVRVALSQLVSSISVVISVCCFLAVFNGVFVFYFLITFSLLPPRRLCSARRLSISLFVCLLPALRKNYYGIFVNST